MKIKHRKSQFSIDKILEKHPNSKYLGDFGHPSNSAIPVAVFYCETPDRSKGHGNYFGYFADYQIGELADPTVYITNGQWVEDLTISGVESDDGTFYYSTSRHDYFKVNEALFLDGGQDYLRIVGNLGLEYKKCSYVIRDGNWTKL